jgi:retinol dehydrogenase-13
MEEKTRQSRILKYWPQYKWSNVWAMLKNNGIAPKICDKSCEGKLVVITGATSGIGYRTARRYAAGGADLLVINRNPEKSATLSEEIQRDFSVRCDILVADLSRLDEIHQVANRLAALERPIDVLFHNAGVYLKKRSVTQDGLETTFVVHYLSSFIMNWILLDKLKRENRARIIYVGSEGYRFAVWGLNLDDLQFEHGGYSGLKAYGSAKTAQLLSMHRFAALCEETHICINAMHPGMVATNTGRENHVFYRWFKKNVLDRASQSPEISAEALYYLGIAPEMNDVTDLFFNLTTQEELTPPASDMEVAEELWQKSLELGRLA